MGSGVNIGAILDFDCLMQIHYQFPKLGLDVILGLPSVSVEYRVKGHF
jgi:hypothetical protein